MTRFFFPDPDVLAASGHDGLASIPVLFDRDYRILDAENQFLLERALGTWPVRANETYRPKEDGIAPLTIIALGRRLLHFADWRHGRPSECHRSIKEMTYGDVLTYEREQWLGQRVFKGRPVRRETAAVRADTATAFLTWATHRDLRGEFPLTVRPKDAMPWTPSAAKAVSRKTKSGQGGTMRALTRVPSPSEIDAWLAAVHKRRGLPKYLICRVMVTTGMRLMEAVALEVDQWPSLEEVGDAYVARRSEIDLLLTVTKNSKIRTVRVPVKVAASVAHWVRSADKGGRSRLERIGVDRRGGGARSTRLFLSDRAGSEGVPIERHTVSDCFREVEPRPAGWHPHRARHAFACHFMTRELLDHAGGTQPEVDRWIDQGGVVAAEKLRRLLGHESLETTRIYLNYLRMNVDTATISRGFTDLLNGSRRCL